MVNMRVSYEQRLAKYFINERQYAGRKTSTLDLLFELDRLEYMKGTEILDLLKVTRGQRWRRLRKLEHVGVITQSREPGFTGRELNVKLTERGRNIVKLIRTWEPNLKIKPQERLQLPEERIKKIEPEKFYDDFNQEESDLGIIDVEESGLTKKQQFELAEFLNKLEYEEEE